MRTYVSVRKAILLIVLMLATLSYSTLANAKPRILTIEIYNLTELRKSQAQSIEEERLSFDVEHPIPLWVNARKNTKVLLHYDDEKNQEKSFHLTINIYGDNNKDKVIDTCEIVLRLGANNQPEVFQKVEVGQEVLCRVLDLYNDKLIITIFEII